VSGIVDSLTYSKVMFVVTCTKKMKRMYRTSLSKMRLYLKCSKCRSKMNRVTSGYIHLSTLFCRTSTTFMFLINAALKYVESNQELSLTIKPIHKNKVFSGITRNV